MAKWDGTYMGNVWLASNKEFAISFNESTATEIRDCDKTFVLTDQGIAILKDEYNELLLKEQQEMKKLIESKRKLLKRSVKNI
jgi:hypothetical protein